MLQDYVRTGTYWAAIQENAADFAGATVVDVGAGSGILSLFAAQAGAARVYAVEASAMADHAAALCAANPGAGSRVTVVRARVESAGLPRACADILVSEPMGTLLLNERMLESYVHARDHLLKPGGRMFPVRRTRAAVRASDGRGRPAPAPPPAPISRPWAASMSPPFPTPPCTPSSRPRPPFGGNQIFTAST